MIWNLLSVLVALDGGLLAVGQVLPVYRNDIQNARRLRSYLEYITWPCLDAPDNVGWRQYRQNRISL